MKRVHLLATLLITLVAFGRNASLTQAGERWHEDSLRVEWETILGIPQAGNLVGTGTGQVTGGGQPWSTTGGQARLKLSDGDVRFEVQGLVLAGGNSIGTPGAVVEVVGTLVCDTNGSATGNSILVNTPSVPLDARGDARFRGNIGPLPVECTTESDLAFLIRIVTPPNPPSRWIAYGAVRRP